MSTSYKKIKLNPRQFTLTTNELLALLRTFGIKTILGLPEDPYEGLSDEEIIDILSDGLHRFFHERGIYDAFINHDHPQRQVVDEITFVILSVSRCAASMVLNYCQTNGKENWKAWHKMAGDAPAIQYTNPTESRHHFYWIEDHSKIKQEILSYLPNKTQDAGEVIELLSEHVQLIRKKPNTEVQGLEKEHPLRLALSRKGGHLWLNALQYQSGLQHKINYLFSPERAWVLENTEKSIRFVNIESEKFLEDVNQMISFFLN